MKIQAFAFVLGSIAPAVACLLWAWRAQLKNPPNPESATWRSAILSFAIYLATPSQFLVTSFLLHGFHGDSQSFIERVSLPWAVANWVTFLGWTFVVTAAAIGQGRLKRPLLFWSVIAPLSAWFVVQIGWNY
jgi:hypothetical protein